LEFPVSVYAYSYGFRDRFRPLAVTACSCAEIVSVLWQARDRGVSPVVILTHPQEYIKRKDVRYTTLRRNRLNQARLQTVLRFLRENKASFVTVPISAISDDDCDVVDPDRLPIWVSTRQALGRMVQNGINDLVWWY